LLPHLRVLIAQFSINRQAAVARSPTGSGKKPKKEKKSKKKSKKEL
jgi:hypothetical protein